MATELWSVEPDDEELVQEVVDAHHPHLCEATIAVLFRSPTQSSKGRVVLGKARKATTAERALVGVAPDFVIVLAFDEWETMPEAKRRALVDHELCHCVGNANEGWGIAGHDLEEFTAIVHRHGLWKEDLMQFAAAVQLRLGLEPVGAPPQRVEL